MFKALTVDKADQEEVERWREFDDIGNQTPILVIRGADSDLLSVETLDRMMQVYPNNTTCLICPSVGHAPTLMKQYQVDAISEFLLLTTSS